MTVIRYNMVIKLHQVISIDDGVFQLEKAFLTIQAQVGIHVRRRVENMLMVC